MTVAAQHLRYTHLDQLLDDSRQGRYALQLYIERAHQNRSYFDALVADQWPLLEHIQTSRPDAPKDWDSYFAELGAKSLSDIADRVFSRSMADVVANDPKLPKRKRLAQSDRLKTCGVVQGYQECPDGHRKLTRFYCDQPKYCRRCARIASNRKSAHLKKITHRMLKRPITGYRMRFLTLTLKKSGDTRKDAERVMGAFSKLWRALFKDEFSAAWRRVEVGPGGMVHLHILLYCKWVQVEDISAKWEELTGDSKVVFIKEIKRREKGDLKKAVDEVCKYVTDMDKWVEKHGIERGLELVYNIGRALHGKRLSESYGTYRRRVFEKRIGEQMPREREESPDRCDCCGKKWVVFREVIEPRGPPQLRVHSRTYPLI